MQCVAKFRLIDIDRLSPGNNQRTFFPKLEELADLVEESGWVQTLYVNDDLTIDAGERRFRACKIVNDRAVKRGEKRPWEKLPCMVWDGDEDARFDLNVAENSGRIDLRFIELARLMQRYREGRGLDMAAIGRKTGFHPDTVSRYISILERAHPKIIERLDNGEQIPIEYLIKIHTISNKDIQLVRLEQWLGNPVAETEAPKSRQRKAGLSRRKQVAVVSLLQESGASDETIQVAQYMAGMRETLPHKWHQKLSRKRPRQRPD